MLATLTTMLVLAAPMVAYGCTAGLSVAPADPAEPLPPTGPLPGTSLTASGTDFPEGRVLLHWGTSTGPVVGEAVADEAGRFSVDIVVPDDVTGKQRVIAQHTAAGDSGLPAVAWADLAAPAPIAAGRDAQELVRDDRPAIAVAGLAFLVVGTVSAWVYRRRRTTSTGRPPEDGVDHLDRELELILAAEAARERTSA